MATSTPKPNLLGEIQSAETVLFWAERVQILELIFFPAFSYVYPAFMSYLWMFISAVINITYGLCFIERQLIRPFTFEPDFVFYAERVGFFFAVLNTLGFMEKGMDLGLDILKLTQLFLILRLVIMVARSLDKLDIIKGKDGVVEKNMNFKIKKLSKTVISMCCQCSLVCLCWIVYASGVCVRLGYNSLVALWNSHSESEKTTEAKKGEVDAKVCESESESKLDEEKKEDEVEHETELVRVEDNEDEVELTEWIQSESDEVTSFPEGEEKNKVEVEHETKLVRKGEHGDEKANELESDQLIHEEKNMNELMAEAELKSGGVNEDVSESETETESEEEDVEEAETGTESEEEEEEEAETGSESEEDKDETGSESESENSKKEVEVLREFHFIHKIRAENEELLEENKQYQAAVAELEAQRQLWETEKAQLLAEIERLQSPGKEKVDVVQAESKSEEVNEDKSVAESETEDKTESESEGETGSESESEDSEEEWEPNFFGKIELALARVFKQNNKQYQSVVAEFEACRKWDEELLSLYLETKELQLKQYQSSMTEAKHAAESQKWEEEKAALTKRIRKDQDYKTEKEELMNKYYKLDQEKGSVEVELGFQKKLAEEYKAGMQGFEEKYMEQREKNLVLAGKLSAELSMVEKMNSQIDDLEAKYRRLEEERFDLVRELAAANYAYEYYRTQRDSSFADLD